MKKATYTFLISGGHLTPALAVIDEIHAMNPRNRVVFIGREYAQERERQKSREREEMELRHIPFYPIRAAKFHRTYLFRNGMELSKFFPSLYQVFQIIQNTHPDVFLSFGGYLAFPVAMVCKLCGIPIVTHEQTRTVGLANQVIGKFANTIAVSYEDSMKYFPKEKTVHTGNPIRPALMKYTRAKPDWMNVTLNKPLLYITGGSQGSHVINQTVSRSLQKLLRTYIVVHQCGGSSGQQYAKTLSDIRSKLSDELKPFYIIREWISDEDVAWLFQHAELVVSRSGANTVQEIIYNKVPAIFIPLPFAHNDEQAKNAQWLEDHGSAMIIPQKDFLPETFAETVARAHRRIATMKARAEELRKFHMEDAAHHLVDVCISMVK